MTAASVPHLLFDSAFSLAVLAYLAALFVALKVGGGATKDGYLAKLSQSLMEKQFRVFSFLGHRTEHPDRVRRKVATRGVEELRRWAKAAMQPRKRAGKQPKAKSS